MTSAASNIVKANVLSIFMHFPMLLIIPIFTGHIVTLLRYYVALQIVPK